MPGGSCSVWVEELEWIASLLIRAKGALLLRAPLAFSSYYTYPFTCTCCSNLLNHYIPQRADRLLPRDDLSSVFRTGTMGEVHVQIVSFPRDC